MHSIWWTDLRCWLQMGGTQMDWIFAACYLDDGTVGARVQDSQPIRGGDSELRAARAPSQAVHLGRQLATNVLANLAVDNR